MAEIKKYLSWEEITALYFSYRSGGVVTESFKAFIDQCKNNDNSLNTAMKNVPNNLNSAITGMSDADFKQMIRTLRSFDYDIKKLQDIRAGSNMKNRNSEYIAATLEPIDRTIPNSNLCSIGSRESYVDHTSYDYVSQSSHYPATNAYNPSRIPLSAETEISQSNEDKIFKLKKWIAENQAKDTSLEIQLKNADNIRKTIKDLVKNENLKGFLTQEEADYVVYSLLHNDNMKVPKLHGKWKRFGKKVAAPLTASTLLSLIIGAGIGMFAVGDPVLGFWSGASTGASFGALTTISALVINKIVDIATKQHYKAYCEKSSSKQQIINDSEYQKCNSEEAKINFVSEIDIPENKLIDMFRKTDEKIQAFYNEKSNTIGHFFRKIPNYFRVKSNRNRLHALCNYAAKLYSDANIQTEIMNNDNITKNKRDIAENEQTLLTILYKSIENQINDIMESNFTLYAANHADKKKPIVQYADILAKYQLSKLEGKKKFKETDVLSTGRTINSDFMYKLLTNNGTEIIAPVTHVDYQSLVGRALKGLKKENENSDSQTPVIPTEPVTRTTRSDTVTPTKSATPPIITTPNAVIFDIPSATEIDKISKKPTPTPIDKITTNVKAYPVLHEQMYTMLSPTNAVKDLSDILAIDREIIATLKGMITARVKSKDKNLDKKIIIPTEMDQAADIADAYEVLGRHVNKKFQELFNQRNSDLF